MSNKNVTPGFLNILLLAKYEYSDIRRGSLDRGRQMRVGSEKMAIFACFACYISRTFTSKTCYVVHVVP